AAHATQFLQRRTNVWRKATSPARAAKRPRSVRVVFRYRRREMTKEERVVGLIFQVTMWAYIATHADLAGIGLRVGDELGNSCDRKRWIHLHDMRHTDDARNRRNITNEVVVEFFEQCCIDCCSSADH